MTTMTMTDPVARAHERLKSAVASGRGIQRAHEALGRARGKAAREVTRADDQAKAAREVERDRISAAERKKQLAADRREKDLREKETPVVSFKYGGKVIQVKLGHRDMVARGTARTAVQRLAYAIEQSFQSRVVTARVTEAIPALPSRWLETLLSSSQELEPAHRLGILKVEETA